MICSTSSVFNILSSWIKETAEAESALLPEEISYIRNLTIYYLENNIRQLQGAVHPDLQKEAYEMLCEYWGESFVKRVEESSRQ